MGNIFISYTRDDRSRVEPLGAVTLTVILSVIGWFLYSKPSYAKTFKNSIGMEFVLIYMNRTVLKILAFENS